ncbi:post-transcriptional regulator [Bacillus sp. P14.5]|uniref:post-transcriptional regulator n=1 Tax=Bacillus sp. P14.5 TaxID=1983400 RepID=UPI001F057C8E|nr:post-transcriptional regulator [Bacillus sp. P14.5]
MTSCWQLEMERGKYMNVLKHPYSHFYDDVKPALISKVEEFEVLGYGKATVESLWTYLLKKKWKKPKEEIRMFELVSDILSVKAGEYMSFETVEAYRSPNWFSDLNEDELKELLKPNKKS